MSDGVTSRSDTSRPRWFRPVLVVVAAFGIAGIPVGMLVVGDGAPLLGLAVFVAGTLLISLATFGWLFEPIANSANNKESGAL